MLKPICFTVACLLIAAAAYAQDIPDSEPITTANAANVALIETLGRGVIHELMWSPDSTQLAVATTTGLYLHDSDDLEAEPLYVEIESGASSVAYSPDGTRIATGSESGTVTIWDAASHEAIFTMPHHLYRVNVVAWSPDGLWLASGDVSGLARVWDAENGSENQLLEGTGSINSVAFSGDGTRLLVGGETAVMLWHVGTWEAELEIEGGSEARWFPDGERILSLDTGDEPRSVNIWDAQNGDQLQLLPHSQTPTSIDISPDGQWVATGSLRDIWLWDANTGVAEPLSALGGPVAFMPDGETLLYGLYPLEFFDMTTHEVRDEAGLLSGEVAMHVSPDGQHGAAISFGRLRLAHLNAESSIRTDFEYLSPLLALDSSKEGNLLVGEETGRACIRYFNEENITYYCGGTGIFDSFRTPITEIAFPPDVDDAFVWGGTNGFLGSESLAESESPDIFEGHAGSISGIVYIQGGERFVTAGEDASIHIYQTATVEEIDRYEAPAPIESLALKPNSNVLAAGDADNHIQLWALGSKQPHMILEGHNAPVRAVTFSEDGAQLASGGDDGVIVLWDTETWEPIATLHGHMRGVTSLSYNVDGSVLSSGSLDGTIRLWDTRSGELLATLEGHTGGVTGIAMLANGRLASVSYDGTIRLWGVEA